MPWHHRVYTLNRRDGLGQAVRKCDPTSAVVDVEERSVTPRKHVPRLQYSKRWIDNERVAVGVPRPEVIEVHLVRPRPQRQPVSKCLLR